MPLLGRHKSLPAGARGSAAGAATLASSKVQARPQQQLVCQSPLFGIRRQLPIATAVIATEASPSGNSNATTGAAAAGNTSGNTNANTRHQAAKHKRISGKSSASYAGKSASDSAGQQQRADATNSSNQLVMLPIDSDHELGSIPQNISSQQIHYAFSIMDTNSDGLIDQRDMSQMLANLGVPIDEAILSHVISTVSKRGDERLISEAEFLSWIGKFVRVCEEPAAARRGGAARAQRHCAKSSAASLAAEAPSAESAAAGARRRRGSGSGLALMRSLGGGGAAQPAAGNAPPPPPDPHELEARNDLRAAFCVFDLDGDGFITLDEVRAGLKLLGESWTQAELQQLFNSCARAGPAAAGQRISIDDFVRLLM